MNNSPRPPLNLSKEGKLLWGRLVDEHHIADPAGLALVGAAAEASDRMRAAREQVDREGMTFTDRWGQLKPHPLLPVERDARAGMIAALRALNLDAEPIHDRPGRPSGSGNKPAALLAPPKLLRAVE